MKDTQSLTHHLLSILLLLLKWKWFCIFFNASLYIRESNYLIHDVQNLKAEVAYWTNTIKVLCLKRKKIIKYDYPWRILKKKQWILRQKIVGLFLNQGYWGRVREIYKEWQWMKVLSWKDYISTLTATSSLESISVSRSCEKA